MKIYLIGDARSPKTRQYEAVAPTLAEAEATAKEMGLPVIKEVHPKKRGR